MWTISTTCGQTKIHAQRRVLNNVYLFINNRDVYTSTICHIAIKFKLSLCENNRRIRELVTRDCNANLNLASGAFSKPQLSLSGKNSMS